MENQIKNNIIFALLEMYIFDESPCQYFFSNGCKLFNYIIIKLSHEVI